MTEEHLEPGSRQWEIDALEQALGQMHEKAAQGEGPDRAQPVTGEVIAQAGGDTSELDLQTIRDLVSGQRDVSEIVQEAREARQGTAETGRHQTGTDAADDDHDESVGGQASTGEAVDPGTDDGRSEGSEPVDVAPAGEEPAGGPAVRGAAVAEEESDAGENSTESAEEDPVDVRAPAGAVAPLLLFQAPELTAAPAARTAGGASVVDGSTGESRKSDSRRSQADNDQGGNDQPRRAQGRKGRPDDSDEDDVDDDFADDAQGTGEDDDAEESTSGRRRRRRRGGRGRRRRAADGEDSADEDGAEEFEDSEDSVEDDGQASSSSRRRRRRRRRSGASSDDGSPDDPPNTVTKVRSSRRRDDVTGVKGSTRLEAKRQRRREGREQSRRRPIITEAEFLARRESVERTMFVREHAGRTQLVVLEDGVLVEHYVARKEASSLIGNVYLGKVQNVLPSMEAAFVDIGRGRNAVLYAGEVNWDAAGVGGKQRRIELVLKPGDTVLVQVSKDPIGHKGARLTSQVCLPGRYLVLVPGANMTGISRKLPDKERSRLKKILREVVPQDAGVIVRTAAEGASEQELRRDVERLTKTYERITRRSESVNAPSLLHGEPDLTVKVIRDVFNEDFTKLTVAGDDSWSTVKEYIDEVAPDLAERVTKWEEPGDVFEANRVDEQIAKALDRKVWLPSGGSLVIDRTEAMTVVDVNTGRFVGSGGNLEETVTRNNLEAAEEIVRQLRLRDIGGIIVIDFIDMVLESNRDLVLRRLVECLGRDRGRAGVAGGVQRAV